MATAAAVQGRATRSRFYVGLTGVILIVAIGGFLPSYWMRIAAGTTVGAPILYVHGMLFSAWVLFLFTQATFVASGQTLRHKDWGLAGVALAGLMAFSVPVAVLNTIAVAEAAGSGDAARRFAAVPLIGLVVWVGLLIVAFANVRRPEIHKRLVIVATVSMLQAAAGRVAQMLAGATKADGPPPVFMTIPAGIAVDLLIVAAMIYDWRTRGRPHSAYVVGGAVVLGSQLLFVPIAATQGWMDFMIAFEGLRG